jgi:heme-degrading monooxygenase HmoA
MQRHNSVPVSRLSRRRALGVLGASAGALSLGGYLNRAAGQSITPVSSPAEASLMYTIVERRTVNPETIEETVQRAQTEFFPRLLAAPGFSGFYLVADEANGTNTAIIVWESKAQAAAFDEENSIWMQTLDDLGHPLLSDNRGETVITVEPEA